MSWASVSSVFSSLTAYYTFPVKRSLFPQFSWPTSVTSSLLPSLSRVIAFLSLIHISQDDTSPNHPVIQLFCSLLLHTPVRYDSFSSLVYHPSFSSPFVPPPFPVFLFLLLQKQFTCQLGLLVRVSLGLMFFSGVPLEAAVISVTSRRAVMPFACCEAALIAGAR